MAKKKITREQPVGKIAKIQTKEPSTRKMKKPVVGGKSDQSQIKDNLADSAAAKLKDLPPKEMAKVSADAPNKSPKVKPLSEAKTEVKTEAESKTPTDLTPQLVWCLTNKYA